jgi:cell division protein FtsB
MSTRATSRTIAPSARTAQAGTATAAPRSTPRATPVRPELRLVPGPTPVRSRRQAVSVLASRRARLVLLLVVLLVGTTLGLLVLNTAIAVDSLKATQLRADNAERAQEVQRLQQQVVTAGTPAKIARAAAAAGMVPAGTPAYLVLDPDGGATLRGIPEPTPPAEGSPGSGDGG